MNPQHSAATCLWYTPANIVEAARKTLGTIDLDPASDEEANKVVQARRYLTSSENGLAASWVRLDGEPRSVFLNPPGGSLYPPKPGKKRGTGPSLPLLFWERLMHYRKLGKITHAVVVAYSIEQLQSTQGRDFPSMLDFAVCIPDKRIHFTPPAGAKAASPTHANAIIYVDGTHDRSQEFRCHFGAVGKVKL